MRNPAEEIGDHLNSYVASNAARIEHAANLTLVASGARCYRAFTVRGPSLCPPRSTRASSAQGGVLDKRKGVMTIPTCQASSRSEMQLATRGNWSVRRSNACPNPDRSGVEMTESQSVECKEIARNQEGDHKQLQIFTDSDTRGGLQESSELQETGYSSFRFKSASFHGIGLR